MRLVVISNFTDNCLPVFYRFCHCFLGPEAAEGHIKGLGTVQILTLVAAHLHKEPALSFKLDRGSVTR